MEAVVLWTTHDIDAAVGRLRAEGREIRDEDISRLSPLKHRDLNPPGRYGFTAGVPAAIGLRPVMPSSDAGRREWWRRGGAGSRGFH
ncbi:transposase [Streptomyces sp. 8L]|nr:transposase [Streptomyces sp. 8L]MCA1218489.1 transposase [Streptomyces sp. 8L]